MTTRSLRAAAVVVLAASIAGCGTESEQSSSATPPTASAPITTSAQQAAASAPTATSASAPTATSWTMPDLVGANLQDAQDMLQRVTDYGVAVTFSHDATGAGREQVLDRNWKVCSQNVSPGESINAETRIDFGAVKLDEDC